MGIWNKWFGKSRKAKAAEAEALKQSERSKRIADAALVNPQDSPAAKDAYDARLRKLARNRGLGGTAAGPGLAAKTLLGQ